ncbi:MAG: ATP-binding protein [Eubacteriales bacterium]|nr:ATP-binding protein [Eubacteriales bacterium]
MKIAVLSGKGGTGKTLLAVNLASIAPESVYVDCDVEEPNGHLFFKPDIQSTETVFVKIPEVRASLCVGCRQCVDFCRFNALAYINQSLLIFDEMCHSCGGCTLICPENALSEKNKSVGRIQIGTSDNVTVLTGIMNTGESSGMPIIKELLGNSSLNEEFVFIDCPPGSSCIVMESIRSADYCILVAEPTLFGMHNLKMVHELVTLMGKPYSAVLNKCVDGDNPSEKFCIDNNIRISGRISFDNKLGTLNSNGMISARVQSTYRSMFESLLQDILKEASHETVVGSKR